MHLPIVQLRALSVDIRINIVENILQQLQKKQQQKIAIRLIKLQKQNKSQ